MNQRISQLLRRVEQLKLATGVPENVRREFGLLTWNSIERLKWLKREEPRRWKDISVMDPDWLRILVLLQEQQDEMEEAANEISNHRDQVLSNYRAKENKLSREVLRHMKALSEKGVFTRQELSMWKEALSSD